MKRQRGRGRKSSGPNQHRNFESNGPDIKIRGSASNVYDKYQQLARDAASSGDRVAAENYLQHAEHYFRVLRSQQQHLRERAEEAGQRDQAGFQGGYTNGRDDDDGDDAADAAEAGGSSASPGPLDVVDPEAVGASGGDGRDDERSRRHRRRRRYEGGGGQGQAAGGDAGEPAAPPSFDRAPSN
jgi:hypothetical protein